MDYNRRLTKFSISNKEYQEAEHVRAVTGSKFLSNFCSLAFFLNSVPYPMSYHIPWKHEPNIVEGIFIFLYF